MHVAEVGVKKPSYWCGAWTCPRCESLIVLSESDKGTFEPHTGLFSDSMYLEMVCPVCDEIGWFVRPTSPKPVRSDKVKDQQKPEERRQVRVLADASRYGLCIVLGMIIAGVTWLVWL